MSDFPIERLEDLPFMLRDKYPRWAIVAARQRGACQRCGSIARPTDCAHVIRRKYLRTRWLTDNAWCLCRECHSLVDDHVIEFFRLVEKTIGEERYEELRTLERNMTLPKPDRVLIRAELRALLKEAA